MTYREVPGGWVCGDKPAFAGNIETADQMRLMFESECRRLEEAGKSMIKKRNDLRDSHSRQHQRIIDLERVLVKLRDELKTAPNQNVSDYIDTVLGA